MSFIIEPGLWCQRLTEHAYDGRAAVFLDRDGVIVEEVNYLRRADDVAMIASAGPAIARINRAGYPVIIVTNQAGIGRGYFTWPDFAEVQARILEGLAAHGAHCDLVLACGYHEEGHGDLRIGGHPWRKPGPGMLREAARTLGVDLVNSVIVGDKLSDIDAGRAAGLGAGVLVRTGHGALECETKADDIAHRQEKSQDFRFSVRADIREALDAWPG